MAKIKSFFISVGRWFKNHAPTRRRIIQVYAALLTNANLKGFAEGQIYTGNTKKLCTPGLNCYSCPGAVVACPLGALQNSLGSSGTTTPYYILGIIALLGLALGRAICGFLCPFGFFQELLYKIRTPKVKKNAYTRLLSYLKYLLLIVLVIAVPLIYQNVPGFCKYVCPAGTFGGAGGLLANSVNADLYGMLGYLFSWKFVLLVVCIVASIFIFRAFCRFICPLGAIYGFFNRIALLGVKLDKSQCIDCGACISHCKMDIKHVGDHECINCGECIKVCPTKAISWKGSKIFLKATSVSVSAANGPQEELKPLNVYLTNGTTVNTEISADNNATVNTEESSANLPQTDETAATEPENVQSDRQAENNSAPAQSKFKEAWKKLNKRAFIMEAVAWVLASAVLISALVYYNTLPSAVAKAGVKLENFTATTYDTAYEGDYTLYDAEHERTTVIVFWSSRNEASLNYLSTLGEVYEEIKAESDLVVVHISNSDSQETVQNIINTHGLNSYEIPFLQDTAELNLYAACGGDGAFPHIAFVNIHSELYSKHAGQLTAEEIKAELTVMGDNTIYIEGDRLFDFTVNTYKSGYKEETFSSQSALGKVFVINFWYVSCGPCVEELPYFNEVLEEYGDEVVMIAIHANNGEKPQPFIDGDASTTKSPGKTSWSDWGIIFGQDTGPHGKEYWYTKLGGKGSYPITIIVDAEGYISSVVQGPIINGHKDALRPAINKAMGLTD